MTCQDGTVDEACANIFQVQALRAEALRVLPLHPTRLEGIPAVCVVPIQSSSGRLLDIGASGLSGSYGCAGERGAEIVDLLRQNAGVAVPVVLSRLDQKDEEW